MDEFHWETPEYHQQERPPDWYWAVIVIAAAGTFTSVVAENYLFALFLILAGGAVIMFARRTPEVLTVIVNNSGVTIGDTHYPFHALEAFRIDESIEPPRLLLRSERLLMPLIVVPVYDVDPDELSDFLLEHLDEEDLEEPLSQRIMELLGF